MAQAYETSEERSLQSSRLSTQHKELTKADFVLFGQRRCSPGVRDPTCEGIATFRGAGLEVARRIVGSRQDDRAGLVILVMEPTPSAWKWVRLPELNWRVLAGEGFIDAWPVVPSPGAAAMPAITGWRLPLWKYASMRATRSDGW